MASVAYGSLPFQQQIAFFRGKKNVLTESWTDVWESQHDNAFMVAGANRAQLVGDFRDAVRKAIEDGATLEDFRRDFDTIVAKHGWDYKGGRNWRSRVIYETNLRQSYNAGRWQQMQALKKAMPYWRYKHNDAVEHPRPIHVSWNDKIWPADDPAWKVIYPQNGWGCQCYVEALSARDLKRIGKNGPDPSPDLEWKDVLVGQRSASGPRLVRTVDGVDPGFAYAPGSGLDAWPQRRGGPQTPPAMQRTLERSAQDVLQKTTRLPVAAASRLADEVLALPRAQDALLAGFAEFQAGAIAASESRGLGYLVGALDAPLAAAMKAAGAEALTAAIQAEDGYVLRALRGVVASELARLPAVLLDPGAVLLDAGARTLLYVAEVPASGNAPVLVVEVQYQRTAGADGLAANAFRQASRVDLSEIRSRLESGRLVLLKGSIRS